MVRQQEQQVDNEFIFRVSCICFLLLIAFLFQFSPLKIVGMNILISAGIFLSCDRQPLNRCYLWLP